MVAFHTLPMFSPYLFKMLSFLSFCDTRTWALHSLMNSPQRRTCLSRASLLDLLSSLTSALMWTDLSYITWHAHLHVPPSLQTQCVCQKLIPHSHPKSASPLDTLSSVHCNIYHFHNDPGSGMYWAPAVCQALRSWVARREMGTRKAGSNVDSFL